MNEQMVSKIAIVREPKIAIFSEHAVCSGDMTSYIRKNFPDSEKPRRTNFRVGAGGVVCRTAYKGYMIVYRPALTEVINDEHELVHKVRRLIELLLSVTTDIYLNLNWEAKK